MDLPEPGERLAIAERYARLLVAVGTELGERPLVLPNADFFPDKFTADERSLAILVERMLAHSGLADVPVAARVVDSDGAGEKSACGSGGCAVPATPSGSAPRLVDDGDGWILHVPEHELGHPVVLTTMIARALGHVFLFEALPTAARPEEPVDLTADYAAVALGFGPLLLEGAYIYSKSCGGPQVGQVTRAPLPELSLLVALFIEMGGHSARRALRELGTTQSALLRDAHAWVQSTSGLKDALLQSPELVAAGGYSPEDAKPWLTRVFGRRSKEFAHSSPATAPERAKDPKTDELRALVDEALGAVRSDAE